MKYKLDGQWYDISLPSYDATPVGTILPYAGSVIPDGYLWCDGSQYLKTDKNDLYGKIGDRYNLSGDTDNTKFRVPNIKGRVLVGLDSTQTEFDTLGETGGEKTHTLTIDEIPSHSHTIGFNLEGVSGGTTGNNLFGKQNVGSNWTTGSQSSGGGQAHNNLQPYIVVNYIIKASSSAVNTSQVVNEHSTSETNVYSANYVNNNFELKGVTLYSDDNGSGGDAPLSDNPTNYSFLVVKHKNSDLGTIYSEVVVKPVIDQVVAFTRVEVTSNQAYLFEKNFTIKSNKLQSGSAYLHALHDNTYVNYNNMVILEVIGYK